MRVGIITLDGYDNYGCCLQAYAVQQILQKHGCKCETLVPAGPKATFRENKKEYIYETVFHIFRRYPLYFLRNISKNRIINFLCWRKRLLQLRYFFDMEIPDSIRNQYDKFIVGSDQVWNLRFVNYSTRNFFLEFADNSQKIALSASMGVLDLSSRWEDVFRKNIPQFKAVSVRESEAAEKIKELTGRDSLVVVDPTMMLSAEEWLKVSEKPYVDTSKKYILTYFLGSEEERERIQSFADKNGFRLYNIYDKENKKLFSSNPGQFISLINNAELVCTDSFHGTVFSILFERPFVCFDRKGENIDMSSRIKTLLSKFELSNRKAEVCSEENWLFCDFSGVDTLLQGERKTFNDFLENALKDQDDM